ncbi:hypothetical protein PT169_07150 [Erysipelothrix rhusiopathiae]|nr:hypothetical protein [Erysipelothrix rhusiopathiae]
MKKNDYFWGFVLVLLAFGLFGSAFNLYSFGPNAFKIAFTVALVAFAISNMPKLNFFGIVYPLTLALWINRVYFNIHGNGGTLFWASTFLAVGLSVIFKRRKRHVNFQKYESYRESSSYATDEDGNQYEYHTGTQNSRSGYRDDDHADYINIEALFTDRTRYIRSKNFTGGYIDNTFASLSIYFDQAQFNPAGAQLEVSCAFGQVKLFIPYNINVINNIDNTLASVSDPHRNTIVDGPTLTLTGDVTLGEIKIVYV